MSLLMKNKVRSIELGIFAVVSLIFLNSAYHLFTDGRFITNTTRMPLADGNQGAPGARGPLKGPSPASVSENVAPAASLPAFVPYETKCQPQESFETAATKVRITGAFCGQPPKAEAGEFKISNTTSRFTATVLSDPQAKTFSTDFIPLEAGANKVQMDFAYKNGKSFPVDLTITRK